MAKKPQPTIGEMKDSFAKGVRFRSYKNDGKGFHELNEATEVTGVLVSVRDHEITDKRTKLRKAIRVYSIRTADNELLRIGSRALLDRLFDDILDEHGGYTVENKRYVGPAMDWILNKVVRFIRGEDTKTGDGNPMGTYEIQVEED